MSFWRIGKFCHHLQKKNYLYMSIMKIEKMSLKMQAHSSSKWFQEYCVVRNAEHKIKKKIPSQFASPGCVTNNGGWCVTFMKWETRYFSEILLIILLRNYFKHNWAVNIILRRKFLADLRQGASLITEDGASLLWYAKPDIFLNSDDRVLRKLMHKCILWGHVIKWTCFSLNW